MNSVTQIGLDVHKETIAVALLRPGEARPDERVIANTSEALRKLVAGLGDPSRYSACYEAGPTGYDTQRLLPPSASPAMSSLPPSSHDGRGGA